MEELEISEITINFGKELIQRLESEDHNDPMLRWVCMHIARLIESSEENAADPLAPVHKECLEVIKGFWASRTKMPYTLRPFKDWEILFETIKKLDREDVGFFGGVSSLEEKKKASRIPEEASGSLDIALILNGLAPRMILFCLRDAAKHLDADFSKQLLAIADEEGGGQEVKAMRFLGIDIDDDDDQTETEKKIEKLQSINSQLLALQDLLPILKKEVENEIEDLSSD